MAGCTFEEGIKYPGDNIPGKSELPTSSKEACAKLCHKEAECNFWFYISGVCWLKTSDSGRRREGDGNGEERGGQKECGDIGKIFQIDNLKPQK